MRLERSYMFVPGTDRERAVDALESVADVVILDLEDTVDAGSKQRARRQVQDTLADVGDVDARRAVRVNGLDTEHGIDDVRAVATADVVPDLLLVPDVRDASEVGIVDEVLDDYGVDAGIHPLIEKPSALFDAQNVAAVSERIHGLMFAAIDFQANMGIPILDETDFSVPRFLLSMAANGAGVRAVDKPNLAAVDDPERTRSEARAARAVGFDGKAAMTTDQAAIINDVFTPSEEELERAERFIDAFEAADGGLATIDGVAVDRPVVEQLRETVERARQAGPDA